ncbi:FecCD family ABC transporter permease [Salinispira pacifica]|uniref:Vitamin B12 ABC transporter, permease component BtuC n=1 Tax=Salinispira pacifica TaxID=1307761 RepID=V5WE07_9SPIO|nr:iron ABC transporter permease [Salinispira pacifica]AHC13814.1 Vitamin B12 ABC transporter, permease component BtuC [Salinispira pacifica]
MVSPILLVFLGLAALSVGRYPVTLESLFRIVATPFSPAVSGSAGMDRTVVLVVRLPRVLTAMLVGSALATSGAALQGVFRNPLVSPGILGVASGAGLGAALCILLFGRSALLVQGSAFMFGILAMMLALAISGRTRKGSVLVLVLAGVVVSALAEALISLVKYVADPEDTLPAIVFWLMGSLSGITVSSFLHVLFPITAGIIVLILMRWRISVLSLGDNDAQSLGVHVGMSRAMVVTATTVVTAAAISVAGIVGWVGLVVPHIARMFVGPDHRLVIPVSAVIGAMYLLVIDTLARSVISAEIPLSILTAVVGAPVFAIMLRKTGGRW